MSQQFGRGLESLIPNKSGDPRAVSREQKKEAVFLIEIDKIKPNPYQPRKDFDKEGLEALAESIRIHGILQPLIVTRVENEETHQSEYQLIAGERRLIAARIAHFTRVPVIIRKSAPQQKLEVSLIENVQRADLNPIEKAEAFKRLQDEFGFSQKNIAKIVGKSREAIANTMRLLSLPLEIQNAIREGKLSEGHARVILMAREPSRQKMVFAKVLREGLSVHETESFVQKLEVWRPKMRTIIARAEFAELLEKVKHFLGVSSVKFKMEAGTPHLIISFPSKKEIEKWLERFVPPAKTKRS